MGGSGGFPNPITWLTTGPPHLIWVKVLLLIELLLLLIWVTLFAVLEVHYSKTTSPDIYYARSGLLFSLLGHLGTPLILTELTHGLEEHNVRWTYIFWMLGNLFTDVWSTTDAWNHLPDHDIEGAVIGILRGFTTTTLVFSSIGLATYAAILLFITTQPSSSSDEAVHAQIQEPLLVPVAKVRPLRVGIRRGVNTVV